MLKHLVWKHLLLETLEDIETKVDIVDDVVDDIETKVDIVDENVVQVEHELSHRSRLFPDDISKTMTFTAGGENFAWSDWAEIVDSGSIAFSTLNLTDTHITAMKIRGESVADKLYQIDIGYGDSVDAVTICDTHEFGSGTKKVEGDEQVRFRPPIVPAGKKIYYKMKCETGGATCNVVLRYHKGN